MKRIFLLIIALILSLSASVWAGNEDFTTYTEVDEDGDITIASTKVEWVTITRADESYVYKDYTANHFNGDLTHQFEFYLDAEVGTTVTSNYGLCNYINDYKYGLDNSEDQQGVDHYNTTQRLYVLENGGYTHDSWTMLLDTLYFYTFERDDDGGANNTGQLTIEIRTGSHAGPLQDTLTQDCSVGEQNDFRYAYILQTYNDGGTGCTDGYLQNLDLNEVAGGLSIPIAMYHYMHH